MFPAQTQIQNTPNFTAKVESDNKNIFFDWNWKKILLLIGSLIVILAAWIYFTNPMVVTVTGSGEVDVPATNATISFTLSATDNSISNAMNLVSAKADSIRNYLTSKGIADTDIAQSQVTAVPAFLITAGATGYQATISMAAKTTHVSEVSGIISDLYSNGALVVAQPILSVENQDKLSQQAFNSALSDANNQATQIGNHNWKFIRKIISISQVTSPSTSTSTTKADTLTGANSQAAVNGVFKIVSAVSVSYKMW